MSLHKTTSTKPVNPSVSSGWRGKAIPISWVVACALNCIVVLALSGTSFIGTLLIPCAALSAWFLATTVYYTVRQITQRKEPEAKGVGSAVLYGLPIATFLATLAQKKSLWALSSLILPALWLLAFVLASTIAENRSEKGRMPRHSYYLLVADEMGTPGLAPGTSNAYIIGGYIVRKRDLRQVIGLWRQIKSELCGNPDVELKWKHFFTKYDDSRFHNPLLIADDEQRYRLALNTVERLYDNLPILPLVSCALKDSITEAFVTEGRPGKKKINLSLFRVGPIGQFASFLHNRASRGEIWFDNLSDDSQEEQWNTDLAGLRAFKQPGKQSRPVLRIKPGIRFYDSKMNEAIQVAEFTMGIIWEAARGDEAFLIHFEEKYTRQIQRYGLFLFLVE